VIWFGIFGRCILLNGKTGKLAQDISLGDGLVRPHDGFLRLCNVGCFVRVGADSYSVEQGAGCVPFGIPCALAARIFGLVGS